MENITKRLNQALELIAFMNDKEWSAEEIAGTIELLHKLGTNYSSDLVLPAFETTE